MNIKSIESLLEICVKELEEAKKDVPYPALAPIIEPIMQSLAEIRRVSKSPLSNIEVEVNEEGLKAYGDNSLKGVKLRPTMVDGARVTCVPVKKTKKLYYEYVINIAYLTFPEGVKIDYQIIL